MKVTIFFICIIFSGFLIAKNDISFGTFNQKMIQNMDEVIKDNPEIYETTNHGRKPASTPKVKIKVEETTESLEKIQSPAHGTKEW